MSTKYKYSATLTFEADAKMSVTEVRRILNEGICLVRGSSHPEDPARSIDRDSIAIGRVIVHSPIGGSSNA